METEVRAMLSEVIDRSSEKWKSDGEAEACPACKQKFTFMRRRHHCRICGEIYCDNCALYIPVIGGEEPARCCDPCAEVLQKKREEELSEKKKKRESLSASLKQFQPCNALPSLTFMQMMTHGNTVPDVPVEKKEVDVPLPVDWDEMWKGRRGYRIEVSLQRDWMPDEQADKCLKCSEEFTNVNRKHHCRACGKIFCDDCTPELGCDETKPWAVGEDALRVCEECCKAAVRKEIRALQEKTEMEKFWKEEHLRREAARADREKEEFDKMQAAKDNKWTEKHAKWEGQEPSHIEVDGRAREDTHD